jgi:hypothetical protein
MTLDIFLKSPARLLLSMDNSVFSGFQSQG